MRQLYRTHVGTGSVRRAHSCATGRARLRAETARRSQRSHDAMHANATAEQVVVIVGAGIAGGNAAVTLREEGWRGRIVRLGAGAGIPFGRPPLSQTYLRGGEDLR